MFNVKAAAETFVVSLLFTLIISCLTATVYMLGSMIGEDLAFIIIIGLFVFIILPITSGFTVDEEY